MIQPIYSLVYLVIAIITGFCFLMLISDRLLELPVVRLGSMLIQYRICTMITDQLSHSEQYRGLHPRIDSAFRWLGETNHHTLVEGEHSVADGVRAIVQSYTTIDSTGKWYEAHRKFIDVQYIAGGRESMLVIPTETLKTDERYDEAEDVIFYPQMAGGSRIVLRQGEFAVFFPQDAHIPMLADETPGDVLKIVVKVAV